jgi:hypothetical protein
LSIKKTTAKTKAAKKPPAKKRSKKAEKLLDFVEVRKDIAKIVSQEAAKMARAVVDEALKGELAPMKYLFEVVGLHPMAEEATVAGPPEDSLARTLWRRLGLEEAVAVRTEEIPAKAKSTAEILTDDVLEVGSRSKSSETAIANAVGSGGDD